MQHKHYDAARRAHYWTSFTPDKRAESECNYFDDICAEFADKPEVVAKFERLFLLSLAAKSRCASAMVTGPANFPVARQQKASEREHRITSEMLAYIDRVRKAKAQAAYYQAHPEARPIMSGDSDAIERLTKKLEDAKKYHSQLKEAKALIKKGVSNAEASAQVGLPEPVQWHSFNIQYANKAVKELEAKIANLAVVKATPSTETIISGIKIVENTEAMRLQLFFNGKPASEIITLLKKNGFKWSPSNMAWQRQLTNNAVYSLNQFILPTLKTMAGA